MRRGSVASFIYYTICTNWSDAFIAWARISGERIAETWWWSPGYFSGMAHGQRSGTLDSSKSGRCLAVKYQERHFCGLQLKISKKNKLYDTLICHTGVSSKSKEIRRTLPVTAHQKPEAQPYLTKGSVQTLGQLAKSENRFNGIWFPLTHGKDGSQILFPALHHASGCRITKPADISG